MTPDSGGHDNLKCSTCMSTTLRMGMRALGLKMTVSASNLAMESNLFLTETRAFISSSYFRLNGGKPNVFI